MGDQTAIEWTDATWNPLRGCSRASEGCRNCYAEILAARFSDPGQWGHGFATRVELRDGGVDHRWTGKVELVREQLRKPLDWKRPRFIFANSTSDLFHEAVKDEDLLDIWTVMAIANHHTFQVLTKRPERMFDWLEDPSGFCDINPDRLEDIYANWYTFSDGPREVWSWPLHNVWLGTSVEDAPSFDARVWRLIQTPAAVRFLSIEPLIGRIPRDPLAAALRTGKIQWVIVGGESGPGARPMHPEWVQVIQEVCAEYGVAFFFKQWGEWAPICAMSEDLTEAIYHPAPVRDPEAIRRCKVDQAVMHGDGRILTGRDMYGPEAFAAGAGSMSIFKVGKGRSGRLLDGQEHNARPEVCHVS